jgi:16S rRNA (cytosine967-C5)-methyltransferase
LLRLLSLAAFELLFLEQIPAYATVHWAAAQAGVLYGKRMRGLANAVLRAVDRDRERLLSPEHARFLIKDEKEWLSIWYSCPRWVVDLWMSSHPGQARDLIRASARQAPIGLRCDPGLAGTVAADNLLARCRTGLAVKSLERLPATALQNGPAERQSMAAQETMLMMDAANWPDPVWDACCGRGGKTLLLAALGHETILAGDIHRARLGALAGHPDRDPAHTLVFSASAQNPCLRPGSMGTVLLDVPCSGLGVLSRRPDIKWKRKPEDIPGLAALQRKMLSAARNVLAPGGRLVYMTCTVNPRENERQIQWALSAFADLSQVRMFNTPADSPLQEFFFAACLRKS